ncbi:hypothetical protein AB6A40_001363 [Gnathostoma spinigerum]|uniref:Tyrosine-protein kinase n=1 Tax=Gnathostoma spinigerum TaxID=75299 RepID=A0ABD6E3Z7_9BILA
MSKDSKSQRSLGRWLNKIKERTKSVRANRSKATETFDLSLSRSTNKDGEKEFSECSSEAMRELARALTKHKWYHGLMPREEIEELLTQPGDFIVRKTEVHEKSRYIVSLRGTTKTYHLLIGYSKGMWYLKHAFPRKTISELIKMHVDKKIVIREGVPLMRGVPRPDFYILHENIKIKKRIGGGAFGDVFKAEWTDVDIIIDVAVKTLKDKVTKEERAKFLKEAQIMRKLNHRNIVRIYGIAPQEEPMMIVMELAANGTLKAYFLKHPDVDNVTLLNFVKDAARGMRYLASQNVIHRDVAARNCLLGQENELKITDFGLSIAGVRYIKLKSMQNVPIKWLAPETLRRGEFSTKSDVWSFGVLIWEIFTCCKTSPFPGESNAEAKAKILSGNVPLKAPPNCPVFVSNIMLQCFAQIPEDRIDFDQLYQELTSE